MKVLVCGGRTYDNANVVNSVLDSLVPDAKIVIHGGASGADSLAADWARSRGIQVCECKANWDYYSKGAGPIRNSAMLLLKPDLVIAFPGGSGTVDMLNKAQRSGVHIESILTKADGSWALSEMMGSRHGN